jgi:cell division septation protein DedD
LTLKGRKGVRRHEKVMEERGKNSGRILKLPLSGTGMPVLLVLIAITVAFLTVTPVMAQQAEVSVNAPEYVEEKETFDVTIDVEGITDFNSGMFDLTFDHKVVKVDDVTDGSIDDTEIPVTLWADMDSDTIRVMLELPETTTVSGSGYLAGIAFKVKGDAGEESALEIAEGELVKYVFEDERATPEAIVVNNWNGAVVKVSVEEEEEEEEEEEPTPTPEANVTESPTPTLAPGVTPKPTATPEKKSTPKPTATPGKKTTPKPTAMPEKKSTPTPTPVPGFEAIFAIAMMSAIAYILVRRR